MRNRHWGIVLTMALAALVSLPCLSGGILHLPLVGSINPVSSAFVLRGIASAEEDAASLLIIELNTPGGLENSMRDIVAAELASSVPIVVFVSPAGGRATSAGVFITLAADIAAMAPGTNIGAAHPVSLLGGADGEESSSVSSDKAASDAAAFVRSIAERRRRNVDWAESAVMESVSLSSSEALEQGVIDLLAHDTDDLLAKLDGYVLPDGRILQTSGLAVRTMRPSLRERLLGLYGLIYEFFHPGIGFGLAAGGICLLLALFGLQVLPVNITGMALILLGMGLIILDAFTPTNGILTAGGVVALLVGSLTLFNIADRHVGLSWGAILAVVGLTTALSMFVLSKGLLIQRKLPQTGTAGMIGSTGTVRRALDPDGSVFIRGEYWNASSVEGSLPVGATVCVDRIEGSRLYVREV